MRVYRRGSPDTPSARNTIETPKHVYNRRWLVLVHCLKNCLEWTTYYRFFLLPCAVLPWTTQRRSSQRHQDPNTAIERCFTAFSGRGGDLLGFDKVLVFLPHEELLI